MSYLSNEMFLLLIVCAVVFLAGLSRRLFRGMSGIESTSIRRHRRMIRMADQVLLKLGTINGQGAQARKLLYLRKVSPYVFEELLLTAFEKNGCTVLRNKAYSGDGGIDGQVIDAQGKHYLIQAKRYSKTIAKAHLLDFGALVARKGTGGFFIHTGRTPSSLFVEANRLNITILSGDRLLRMLTPLSPSNYKN